jgi:ribonucleoside-triphosphate reductase
MEGIPNELTIKDIQDLVEHGLMCGKRKDVATAYIEYRYDRDKARKWNSQMMRAYRDKLAAKNIENQNANVDEHSFGGRRGEAHAVIDKQDALDNYMCEKSRNRHNNNEIYIHDLSEYTLGNHNCLTVPFDDLLAKGFDTRQTDIRPANSVNTAFQLVAVVFQLQSLMQFGGVSASHLDWTMVPYVRKSFNKHFIEGIQYILEFDAEGWDTYANKPIDWEGYKQYNSKVYKYAMDMTVKETQQAVEGMYHNLNTLQSRSGNQLPFTSINYGTCTLPEGRLVIKAILEGSLKGVGKFHKTPIFPCGIFQLGKGINRAPGDPNYDLYQLAIKSTARRLYPNYANIDWSGNAGYDKNDPRTYFSTMGCRTANGWDINGFGQLKDGRGNICPVTIILPTIAMEAKEKVQALIDGSSDNVKYDLVSVFLGMLDDAIHDAKDMLIERFEYICSQDPSSAKFMYKNGTMAGYVPEEGIRSALKHGTLAVGQLGLAECLEILIGENHTTEKGMEVAKRIEQLFKDRCAEFKEEYKLNFGVYYTPAENLCYTAMNKFKAKYGEIPGVSDREYFTNSMHVPVWEEISPFEKIDIESQLTPYSSAGCITYVEFDSSAIQNPQALETVINYAMDHDVPYFAINVPADLCNSCGYTGLINDTCPECGGHDIQHLRRVTGYLTGDYKTAFNLGKQAEVRDRFKHSKKMNL